MEQMQTKLLSWVVRVGQLREEGRVMDPTSAQPP